jgi:hypothetical protein
MSYDQIPVQVILDAIEVELRMVYQWSVQFAEKRINVGFSSNVLQYMQKAEALIELLEVHDCGSVGGFDEGNKGLYSLEERYEALKEKERTFLLLQKLGQK